LQLYRRKKTNAMSNETPTPRSREEWRRIQRLPDRTYSSKVTYGELAHGMSNFARQLERELAEVTKQRDEAREKIELTRKWSAAIADIADNLRSELAAVTEQRDALAEALEQLMTYQPQSTVITMNVRQVWRDAKEALATMKGES
jgi:predicted nucleic acid-binding protein